MKGGTCYYRVARTIAYVFSRLYVCVCWVHSVVLLNEFLQTLCEETVSNAAKACLFGGGEHVAISKANMTAALDHMGLSPFLGCVGSIVLLTKFPDLSATISAIPAFAHHVF